jgi:hypothetical protein
MTEKFSDQHRHAEGERVRAEVTSCYALKLGTESSGDFKNIVFSNCTVFSQRDKWNRGPVGAVSQLNPLTAAT